MDRNDKTMDTPDREWMFNQSGVIPIRREEGGLRILLITSRKKKHWVIPKGIVEPHLSPGESAAQEAMEEAGICGRISASPIGEYAYAKWGGTCHVKVFLMEVVEERTEWPESSFRERRWAGVEEAAELVDEDGLSRLIRLVPGHLTATRGPESG